MLYTNGDNLSLDAEIAGRLARRAGEPMLNGLSYPPGLREVWKDAWLDEDATLRGVDRCIAE